MWQGQTEANLERILAILDSIGPVAVMIDEADAALGSRDARMAPRALVSRGERVVRWRAAAPAARRMT